MRQTSEALFIGGRSGVGKTSVGYEIHHRLARLDVRHCLIEGDNLDMAHPFEHGLAERNLAAMWGNYRAAGYRRMIYANTASVRVVDELTEAMGDRPRITAVLLTATDATAHRRLAAREIGGELRSHVERGIRVARELDEVTPRWVHRVRTDDRDVGDIAREVIDVTGWAAG